MGHNSGFETGLVATKLIKKVAISSSVSFERAYDNKPNYVYPTTQEQQRHHYTLSFGNVS
jgi:hypothetical protein